MMLHREVSDYVAYPISPIFEGFSLPHFLLGGCCVSPVHTPTGVPERSLTAVLTGHCNVTIR